MAMVLMLMHRSLLTINNSTPKKLIEWLVKVLLNLKPVAGRRAQFHHKKHRFFKKVGITTEHLTNFFTRALARAVVPARKV